MKHIVVALTLVLSLGSTGAFAQRPPPPPQIDAAVREVPPFNFVCRPCTGPYSEFAREEEAFLSEFKQLGIRATNVQMGVYWNSPLYVKPAALKWDIGFPVASGTRAGGGLVLKRFKWPKVAVAVHVGPYSTTHRTINALYGWIARNGLKTVGGPCVEHYLDPQPESVPDAQKRTAIWIPVR